MTEWRTRLLSHLRRNAPYVAVFAIAAYLYFLARQIDFAAPGGRIGPDFWPKAILLLAMATCAAGATAPKTPLRMIGDKGVFIKGQFASKPMIEVKNLQFFDATLEETGAQATVVAGEVWNMTACEGFSVTLEIDLWRGNDRIGTTTFKVDRPGMNVPVRFSGILPACYNATWWKGGCRGLFVTRLSVQWAKPQ
mgnify:CR=1 FL=1